MADDPILSVRGASKRFGGVQALQKVSFDLQAGEVLALAGDNGAGKSTLIKCISGVHAPDEGEIFYKGQPVAAGQPARGAQPRHRDDLSGPGAGRQSGRRRQRVSRARAAHPAPGHPAGDRPPAHAPGGARGAADPRDRAAAPASSTQPVRTLSGGQRQAVAIGRAIYWQAEVLIMDEPTAALGVPEQRKVRELIARLKQQKVGIIFISHNLVDIFAVADRILVLRRGIAAGERRTAETDHDEIVRLMIGAEPAAA